MSILSSPQCSVDSLILNWVTVRAVVFSCSNAFDRSIRTPNSTWLRLYCQTKKSSSYMGLFKSVTSDNLRKCCCTSKETHQTKTKQKKKNRYVYWWCYRFAISFAVLKQLQVTKRSSASLVIWSLLTWMYGGVKKVSACTFLPIWKWALIVEMR